MNAATNLLSWTKMGVCLSLAASLMGCSTLGGRSSVAGLDSQVIKDSNVKPVKGLPGPPEMPGSPSPEKFYLELRGTNKKPVMAEATMTGPTTVQKVLENGGALKKFRKVKVEIQRPLVTGQTHILPCEYDIATRRINPQFDYAVLPGDKVVVTEDSSTILEDMVRRAMGPVSGRLLPTTKTNKLPEKYKLES